MNALSKIIIAASLLAGTATAASATCNINYRQHNQAHRIYDGVYNGKLGFYEFKRLAAGQAKVRRMERIARLDGWISPLECAAINNALNWQSARIYHKKHN
jgi:hypothetical protein